MQKYAKLLPIGAAERKRDSAQPQQWSASAIARSLNNGAAREGSPGRQPGVFSCLETKRRRREPVTESFAPMGLDLGTILVPGLTPGDWGLDIYATSSRGLPCFRLEPHSGERR